MEYAARQAADGYTFVVGNLGPVAVNPLFSKVPYNMERDFLPVALTATGANILVVNANSPYKSLQDILAAARARPGVISFGTSGPGSMSHLSGELLMRQARHADQRRCTYKGGILAVNDVVAGHLDMIVADALPVSQFIKANRVRPIAMTGGVRSRLSPRSPPSPRPACQGWWRENWWGVFVPTGTPGRGRGDQYHGALVKVMVDPDLKAKFARPRGRGDRPAAPADFRAFLAAEDLQVQPGS